MISSKPQAYLHFVWATQARSPLITPAIERDVYRLIGAQVVKMGCQVISIGGMPDYVHLLVRYGRLPGFGQFMNRVKGASSRALNDKLHPDLPPNDPARFRWQGGYGVFSVDYRRTDEAIAYIRGQKEHHANNTVVSEWEEWEDGTD